MASTLIFKPINLQADIDKAWEFRQDRIAPDFDPTRDLNWKNPAEYADFLEIKRTWNPFGATHVWQNGQIIGQIECAPRGTPPIGYVNFYYLIPSMRNQGLGMQLVEFTEQLFRSHNFPAIQLSTTPAHTAARAFYKKAGFTELGPRPDKPQFLLLEKPLSSTTV